MDKNTFWSYTTPLPTHFDGVEEGGFSSASEQNTERQQVDVVVYIASEDILNVEIEVRDFNIADSGLGNSNRSFRERIFLSKNEK
ncbi:hypothetical protein [Pectobacterium polonicum]|uniref:hypothetical protein n=1 Tax=Pectobacterium polonicum TaxID=2485124 RepID=UPI002B249CB6|nr:hypothetical protein [Pectobacterium polonicum]